MDIDAVLKKQSAFFIITVGLILNVAIGVIDYLTGYHFHMSAFYLIPVFFTVWYNNIFAGIGMSFVTAFIMFVVYWATVRHHNHALVALWNIFLLFTIYNVFAFVLSNLKLAIAKRSEMKELLIAERKKNEYLLDYADQGRIVAELREALSKVRTLTGLVTVCASCKNVCYGSAGPFDDKADEILIAEFREVLSKAGTLADHIPACVYCKKINNDGKLISDDVKQN